ncbi:HIT family protein [Vibrio sp. SCSIO 43132]|uniref:HIT family protein n=1 Tax=Vibrio sp. SCSIO 43132 TaxID=2779363 RepID=UPI001CA847A3|nr:HIT family protein [Vibrio sp. SCSIO 43132]UAB73895.1 HIT family protein [Vibrio sp. SCSIO 43132]
MYNHEPKNYLCPFCRMSQNGISQENDIVYEADNVFACISLDHHENSGPTFLVVPKLHVENIYYITDELLSEIMRVAKSIAIQARELWDTDGITIWQHNEPSGSQDVWHLHVHVKCRFAGDNLYASKNIKTEDALRNSWARDLRTHLSLSQEI